MKELIHPDQKLFVQGRTIGENILDLYAIMEEADEQDDRFVAIMIDIEKAFDSVRWDFLWKVLRTVGLPEEFIRWIQILYTNKELRVTNHGYLSDPLTPTRGVTQGCGLSPVLFILVMEALACTIRNQVAIQGITIDLVEKKISFVAW